MRIILGEYSLFCTDVQRYKLLTDNDFLFQDFYQISSLNDQWFYTFTKYCLALGAKFTVNSNIEHEEKLFCGRRHGSNGILASHSTAAISG